MARINRLTSTNRSACIRGRRLAAPSAATRPVIVAAIVIIAGTGLAGFTWSGPAVAGTVPGQSPVARPGSSYWMFSLIGIVADSTFVLLTAALVFMYFLLRRNPTDLHVRRSGGSGPGPDEPGAGQPGGAVARPRTKLLTSNFDWPISRNKLADKPVPWENDAFASRERPLPPLDAL